MQEPALDDLYRRLHYLDSIPPLWYPWKLRLGRSRNGVAGRNFFHATRVYRPGRIVHYNIRGSPPGRGNCCRAGGPHPAECRRRHEGKQTGRPRASKVQNCLHCLARFDRHLDGNVNTVVIFILLSICINTLSNLYYRYLTYPYTEQYLGPRAVGKFV